MDFRTEKLKKKEIPLHLRVPLTRKRTTSIPNLRAAATRLGDPVGSLVPSSYKDISLFLLGLRHNEFHGTGFVPSHGKAREIIPLDQNPWPSQGL